MSSTPARVAEVRRDTKETQIRASLKIEGKGRYDISTGIRFFDHMLELFTKHGGFDLTLKATGDLDVQCDIDEVWHRMPHLCASFTRRQR